VETDSEDKTDDEETVRYDGGRRGRFQLERVKNKFPDIIGQNPASLEDIPSAIEEDVTHPGMVLSI